VYLAKLQIGGAGPVRKKWRQICTKRIGIIATNKVVPRAVDDHATIEDNTRVCDSNLTTIHPSSLALNQWLTMPALSFAVKISRSIF
jgi:hypothetical protein